jgi:hypothetical protein
MKLKAIPLLLLLGLPTSAHAGLFGGFASDGSAKRGQTEVCPPVSQSLEMLKCKKVKPADMARMRFVRGAQQRGGGADVVVDFQGTKLRVLADRASGSKPLFVWDTGQPIARVGAVFLSKGKDVVAIEFATRFGGRTVDDLAVIRLHSSLKAKVGKAGTGSAAVAGGPGTPAKVDEDSPAMSKALKAARKLAKRRKHPALVAEVKKVLAERADHPEALYLWARSALQNKKRSEALDKLRALHVSKHTEAPRWRVEARFDKAFKSLRADPAFRKSVGIDPDPAQPLSAYERLVGLGGKWEQEALACEQPRVNLTMKRNAARRFDLVIRSNCQGIRETTRLDGSWRASGTSDLELHFPNVEGPEEKMQCALEICSDGSGEDCLRCQPEPDIEFLFRPVRR